MKLLRLCLVIALGIVCLQLSRAQNASLTVLDPQFGWPTYRGTLEEATVTLRPIGMYTEVGLYLTVSAKGAGFQMGQQLEAVLNFSLPKNSIVNDSWLWIDSTIIKAKILDRWTASTIYENIVNRRRDPSILTKEGNDRYILRIYPLIMGNSRKIKINYLVPGEWSPRDVQTLLPAEIFRSSLGGTPEIDIRAFLEAPWQNPTLPSHPEVVFTPNNDPLLGKYYAARLPKGNLDNRDLSFGVNAPLKNGLFLSRYGNDQQGYYQMVLFPDQLLEFTQNLKPKRMMVLVHFAPSNSQNITAAQVLDAISRQLKRVLRPQDFFNVVLSSINPQSASADWISASTTEIDRVFTNLKKQNISSFNVPGLLARGLEQVKTNGQEAKVLVFSNSGAEGNLDMSNDLIRELNGLKGTAEIPFYIADYANLNLPYYYFNNRSYTGNEYFYLNWSRTTKGEYLQQFNCCSSFDQLASNIVDLAMTEKGTLDLHTSLQNGFCYNRYNLNQDGEFNDLRKPILQVGRYQGKWPFVVELSGNYGNSLFFDGVSVPLSDVSLTDSTGADVWSGNYIATLEKNLNSNNNTAEVINISIRERILSLYTAFLCLEPAQGGEPCLKCLDQSQGQPTVGTQDLQDSLILSKISPNPFRERVMIRLQFKDLIDLSNAKILVYNHVGQVVRTFSDVPKGKIQNLELQWDGRSDGGAEVPAGMYIFRLQTPTGQYSRKLMKLEN